MIEAKDDNFSDLLQDKGTVLVYFSAPWCGPCRQFGPRIEEFSKIFPVIKVNVDDCPELCQRFNIKSVPTCILFENKVVAKQKVGVMSDEQLKEFIS